MTLWLNGGASAGYYQDRNGPTWVNNAEPAYQQYDSAPQYDWLAYRQPMSYDSYSYGSPGAYQSRSEPPRPFNTSFSGGRDGETRDGMVSQKDHATIMSGLMGDKYESALGAWQRGELQNPYTLNELKYQADRFANIAQQGGYTGQTYSRSQFEVPWYEYNAAAKQWGGTTADVEQYLPPSLRGQNTGEQWQGFQATPIGTSFGDGYGGGDAWGTAAFGPEQARVVLPDLDRTRNNVYNGGDLRSANDFGSYQTALLRSGADDIGAVARITPRGFGSGTATSDASGFNQRYQELAKPPADTSMRGPIMQDAKGYYRDNNYYDTTGKPADIERFGGAGVSAGGTNLPWMIADTMPVEIQSTAKNIYDGFNIINDMNPANLIDPKRIATNAAIDAGLSFALNPMTWRGDGGLGGIAQYLAQPWANRSLAPMNYGMAMRLFR